MLLSFAAQTPTRAITSLPIFTLGALTGEKVMPKKNFSLDVLPENSLDRPIGESLARVMLAHIGRQTATPSVLAYSGAINPKKTFVAAREGC